MTAALTVVEVAVLEGLASVRAVLDAAGIAARD